MHLSVAHNPSIKNSQAVEVVVFARGTVMRAEVKMESAYASIDIVSDKIARKMRKYKERKERKGNHGSDKTVDVSTEQQSHQTSSRRRRAQTFISSRLHSSTQTRSMRSTKIFLTMR